MQIMKIKSTNHPHPLEQPPVLFSFLTSTLLFMIMVAGPADDTGAETGKAGGVETLQSSGYNCRSVAQLDIPGIQ